MEKQQLTSVFQNPHKLMDIAKCIKGYRKQKHVPTYEGFKRIVELIYSMLDCYNPKNSYADLFDLLSSSHNVLYRDKQIKTNLLLEICNHPIWQLQETWKSMIDDKLQAKLEEYIIANETSKKLSSMYSEDLLATQKKLLINILQEAINFSSTCNTPLSLSRSIVTNAIKLYDISADESSTLFLEMQSSTSFSKKSVSLKDRIISIDKKVSKAQSKWEHILKKTYKFDDISECILLLSVNKSLRKKGSYSLLHRLPYKDSTLKIRSYIWTKILGFVMI
jgi:hypothetical protein